jgi:hypothetical protein
MKISKFLVIPAFLGAAVAANAATQTIPFSFTPTGSVILTFDRVDIAVGLVESVTVSVNMSTANGTIEADNDSADVSGSYTAEFGAQADLTHSAGAAALFTTGFASEVGANLSATDTQSGSLSVDDGDDGDTAGFDVGGSDYFFFAIDSVGDSDSGIIDSSQYSNYIGTGTYTITVSANQFQSITGVGGVSTLTTPITLSGSVTVTVVPEPNTYAALFGLAALGLVAIRRRR